MSRHQPGGSSSSGNIPRSAAERRVLEQLQAQSAGPARRTLPRPAATSPLPASDALLTGDARVRRPRSRLFGAPAGAAADGGSLLQDILDEFPEIDATTVSVLLSMHDGRRSPVVHRLAEVYRVPGKPPQKRHSFPASALRDAAPAPRSRTHSLRVRRPFSVDRIDDDDEEEEDDVDASAEQVASHTNGEPPPPPTASPPSRGSGASSKGARSFTATSTRRHSSRRRNPGSPQPSSSGSRQHSRHRSRRARGDVDGSPSGGEERAARGAAAATTSPRYVEERAAEPLLAPWGQELAPRARGDAVPPVTLAPGALRARSLGSPGAPPPFTLLHSAAVVAEPAVMRVRGRAAAFAADDERDENGPMEEEGSVSSTGTASSNTRGSPAASSARSRSSARSSAPSSARAGSAQTASTREGRESDASPREGRDATARAAAVLRGITAATAGSVVGGRRYSRNGSGSGGEGLSRRQRGTRSMRELRHAVRDGLSRARGRESCSEEEGDGEEQRSGNGDSEEYGRDEQIERAGEYGDGSEDTTLRTLGVPELLVLRGDTSEVSGGAAEGSDGGSGGYVRVELSVLQGLVRKLAVAERALNELQHESKERVAELLKAVNAVSASLSHYDERQQKRFDVLSAVFTGNNDSIERLTCTMLTIRSELRDYETRRSRRFWRMIGLKIVDLLAYVALFVVWLCASVYNVGARQRRAFARLVSGGKEVEGIEDTGAFQRHASFEAARDDGADGAVVEGGQQFTSSHNGSEYDSVLSEHEIDVGGEGVEGGIGGVGGLR